MTHETLCAFVIYDKFSAGFLYRHANVLVYLIVSTSFNWHFSSAYLRFYALRANADMKQEIPETHHFHRIKWYYSLITERQILTIN